MIDGCDMNPHRVFDGPWGGWGPSSWFSAERYGWKPGDVLERETLGGDSDIYGADGWRWVRVWESSTQAWRALTHEEIAALPDAGAV